MVRSQDSRDANFIRVISDINLRNECIALTMMARNTKNDWQPAYFQKSVILFAPR